MEYKRVATCAERIKTALEVKGVKQSELCRITKIPKSALSQYISGAYEPKQDRIYIISKVLNVSEAWLMGLDVPMERTKEKTSPSAANLTDGERMLLDLYRRVSDDTKEILITMLDSFDRLPEDRQKFALQVIRAALGDHQ